MDVVLESAVITIVVFTRFLKWAEPQVTGSAGLVLGLIPIASIPGFFVITALMFIVQGR